MRGARLRGLRSPAVLRSLRAAVAEDHRPEANHVALNSRPKWNPHQRNFPGLLRFTGGGMRPNLSEVQPLIILFSEAGVLVPSQTV